MIQGLKNPKNAAVLGYGAIFLSALFFGSMGLFARMVQGTYPASLFNMIRGILGILVLLGLSRFNLFPLKGKHFKLLAARGILGGFASICFFKAIIAGVPLATATVLLYTFPIFGAIFSWILLKEKLNAGEVVTIFVAFIGVLSALLSLQLDKQRQLGILRALGLTARELWALVMLETGLMGVVAGLLACPAGYALSLILVYVINRRSFGWTLQMLVEPAPFIEAGIVAVVAALLAGIYPAYRMSKMVTAEALRFQPLAIRP